MFTGMLISTNASRAGIVEKVLNSIYIIVLCLIPVTLSLCACSSETESLLREVAYEEMYSIRMVVEYAHNIYALCDGGHAHEGFYLYKIDKDANIGEYIFTFPTVEIQYHNGCFYYCDGKKLYSYELQTFSNTCLLSFDKGDRVDVELVTDEYLVYETNYCNSNGIVNACSYDVIDLRTMEISHLYGNENMRPLTDWVTGEGRWVICYMVNDGITMLYDLQDTELIPEITLAGDNSDVCVLAGNQFVMFDENLNELQFYSLEDKSSRSLSVQVDGVLHLAKSGNRLFLVSRKNIYLFCLDTMTLEDPLCSADSDIEIGNIFPGEEHVFVITPSGEGLYSFNIEKN